MNDKILTRVKALVTESIYPPKEFFKLKALKRSKIIIYYLVGYNVNKLIILLNPQQNILNANSLP